MSQALPVMKEITPHLADLTTKVLYGDVWERPGLSKRDRSLITVAALTALYRTDQLRVHIRLAVENGVTKEEICEVITHMAFYGGWPTAANAVLVAKKVFDELKI
ncbi:MAG: carboxymuconolactone decarboxylase family protein [Acidobacteria bacterium]|nr:carboxymuconolactone decarboxylase family protein [Acidobacteriota bacterium]MCZ6491597.1 carboxymuconolactone decarboxylase family protein [Acidobacteriota bacterium]MCZ6750354.1 carboxymuconolactone decarboxylase family protein [Acidobacteriota bacterium]